MFSLVQLISLSSQNFIEEKKISIDAKYAVQRIKSNDLSEKPLTFVAKPFLADIKYGPTLRHISSPNESENDKEVLKYKKENQHLKGRIETTTIANESDISYSRGIDFEVGETLYGDIDGACPNDNTIAVGKNGKIVSMMNGEVGIFNTSGGKLSKYNLYSFFYSYIGDPCDPLVQYDVNQDRYIMFVQACGNYKDKIAFGFSQTNDPNGDWYVYVFDSDALGDGSWSDYPKLAITRDEAFVGINLFSKEGSFRQSIIYQMDKMDGYAGNSLTYKIWDGIDFTPLPVTSGIVQYYPGAYVVCSESAEGTSLTLYDITNNLGSGDLELIKYSVPVDFYKVPLSASQYGTSQNLDSGDSRMQSGYYQNKIIHAVHTVSDKGYAAIKYYRINPNDLSHKSFTITGEAAELDYCYPAIVPFTKDSKRDESFISFHSSGTNYYPAMRGKVFNHDFTTIASKEVKSREGVITSCYDEPKEYNRWGDYMGLAYHHGSSTPKVWMAGSLSSNNLGWVTYIAEAIATDINTSTTNASDYNKLEVFPNPANQRFAVHLNTTKSFEANFLLYNETGQLISNLYKGGLIEGENKFTFETSSLNNGIYFLQISNNNNEIIQSNKIIINH